MRYPALERAGVAFSVVVTAFFVFWLSPSLLAASEASPGAVVLQAIRSVGYVCTVALVPIIVGVGAAVYVAEFCARKLQTFLTIAIECLAVIPGAAYALSSQALPGALVRVPIVGAHMGALLVVWGVSAPTIALLSVHVLRSVAANLRDAAAALGATKTDIFLSIVLPMTWRALAAACLFGVVRALGESMAIAFVTANVSAFRDGSALYFCDGDPPCIADNAAIRVALLVATGTLSVIAYGLMRSRVAPEET